jgi:ATP-dependent protease HslVU (ClpYQ) peptidase subunit
MTIVAVKKNKDSIEISCDSQITRGIYKMEKGKDNIKNSGKIFRTNGMVIGGAGYSYESNLLKLFSKNHKPKEPILDYIMEFMLEFRD